jgi:putative CocE/NonD family hydrolase
MPKSSDSSRSATRSVPHAIPALLLVALLGFGFAGNARAGEGGAQEPRGNGPALNTAFHVEMRDGVRIAVDLWLPGDAGERQPVTTVLRATRYTRDQDILDRAATPETDSEGEARGFVAHGYAEVIVDARGTGASFGTRSHPWSSEEVADYAEIVDFIVAQPWSDGRIAAFGTSYDGNTAEMIGTLGHPAVQAVVPRFNYPNVYTDVTFPGGIFNQGFVKAWLTRNRGFDANDFCQAFGVSGPDCDAFRAVNGGVKPVDGDAGRTERAAAVAEHAGSPDQYAAVSALHYADDEWSGEAFDVISPGSFIERAELTRPAFMAWASWMDLGTAQGALNRWAASDVPMVVVIGPWSHDGAFDSNPYRAKDAPLEISREEQQARVLDFLDARFKPTHGRTAAAAREIFYYTLGENAWKATSVWPPAGTATRSLYFAADGRLSNVAPKAAQSADEYRVDFSATTGPENGWWTKFGPGDVYQADRRAEDEKLLVYTSAPLEADTEITGHAQVTLYLASTDTDGAVFVYLEDVAPDGSVTYITEGELRLVHRKLCSEPAARPAYGPCHSFNAEDAAPFPQGVTEEVTVGLMPTSVLLRAGHSIRVALAGHDADNFARLPARGTPTWTLAHDAEHRSRIELPIAAEAN